MYNHHNYQKKTETSLYFCYDLQSLIDTVAAISEHLALIGDLDSLVGQATCLIQEALGYDEVTIYLPDTDLQHLVFKIQASSEQLHPIQGCNIESLPKPVRRVFEHHCTVYIDNDSPESELSAQVQPTPIRSELFLPLDYNNTHLGVLGLSSSINSMFGESNTVFVLRTLAYHLADFIYRLKQRSFDTLTNAETVPHSDSANLNKIFPAIQQLTDNSAHVFDSIVLGLVEGLGYTGAMLNLFEEDSHNLTVQAIAFNKFTNRQNWQKLEDLLGMPIIENGVSVLQNQENIGVQSCLTSKVKITHNLHHLLRPIIDSALSQRIQLYSGIQTIVAVPLVIEKQVIGNLCVGTNNMQITQPDLDMLNFYASNAAVAIRNAIYFEHIVQDLDLCQTELTQLRSITRTINTSIELPELLKRILNGALDLTKAEYGQVVLAGKYASDLVSQVSFPELLGSVREIKFGITQAIIQEKKPKLINDTSSLELLDHSLAEARISYDPFFKIMKSLVGVPILLEDELIGVINIVSQKEDMFNKQSVALLEQLAIQASIAINNAHKFKSAQEVRERLANVTQVIAMSDMASNMVHSINNQVGSIRADVKYLQQRLSENKVEADELAEILGDMLYNAEATLDMAENIRKPFQHSEQEMINVNDCIRNVLCEMHPRLTKVIVVEALEELPPVLATRQLELVFENLITNALAMMKEQMRGILRFTTSTSPDGAWVEATIHDSGPGLFDGISPEDIFKLGVSGRKDGLGYGLWWCDTFLKRWGGQIQLLENVGRGCKFLIKLPTAASMPTNARGNYEYQISVSYKQKQFKHETR